jgi:hypothetical protein
VSEAGGAGSAAEPPAAANTVPALEEAATMASLAADAVLRAKPCFTG